MTACTGEPVSWLRLERYALRELPEREQSEVASHLAGCAACSECFARIEQPAAPDLTFLEARPARRPQQRRSRWSAWPVWAGLASAAAAALLILRAAPDSTPAARRHVKGGDYALELVRLDAENRAQEPTHFDPNDRLKVLITCPPAWRGAVGVAVYQAGKTYTPLAVQRVDDCGNRRALPGAFRLDGTARALVCASFASSEAEWRDRVDRGAGAPPEGSVCTSLESISDKR